MENKKRILFVMDGMKVGGVESALISVFHHLDFERCQADLLLLHDDKGWLGEVPPEVTVYSLERSSSSGNGIAFFFAWFLMRLFRFLRCPALSRRWNLKMQYAFEKKRLERLLPGGYDEVIAYKQGEAENAVAFSMRAKHKILFYHHGSILDDTLHSRSFGHFDTIVAVSDGVGEMLKNHYPIAEEKLCVIPNYIDVGYIRKRAAAYAVERPQTPFVYCTVGRFSPEKNFLLALQTAEELKRRGKRFVWYLIGDGEQRKELETYRDEHGLQSEMVFTRMLDNPLPYVSLCDVYIQTSDVESYGLSIQEAMVLRKPVVSTKTIGSRTLLTGKKNAVLAESDKNSLADGVCRLPETELQAEDTLWNQTDGKTEKLWRQLLKM